MSFDYAFVGDKGEITSQEQAGIEEGSINILVGRDNVSKSVFSHIVPVKGVNEKGFAVDAIISDVVWMGYTKVMLKTDNDAAILKLLKESLRELRVEGLEQVMSENAPEYDPQANGSEDIGVQRWKGHDQASRRRSATEFQHDIR